MGFGDRIELSSALKRIRLWASGLDPTRPDAQHRFASLDLGGLQIVPKTTYDGIEVVVMSTAERLVERARATHTALLCDVLDSLGLREQFLGPALRPLSRPGVAAGWAHTLSTQPARSINPEKPYEDLLGALDNMPVESMVVISGGYDSKAGLWGELLSIAADVRGGAGAVVDGLVRDLDRIQGIEFAVHGRGASPVDSRGRVDFVRSGKIEIGGCSITDGDLVVADEMGVVVVPLAMVNDVLTAAETKARGEGTVRDELNRGRSIVEVFERHGIL